MDIVPTNAPSIREAAFAEAVAAGSSYADAYRASHDVGADMLPSSLWKCASRLATRPAVVSRIRELRTAAAERATISVAERMAWLDAIVHANPDELRRVVIGACPVCWTDATYATAVQAYLDALATPEPLPPPDTEGPNDVCLECKGDGITRTIITPTAQLSSNARALYKGARMKANGEIEILMHDQLAACRTEDLSSSG